MMDPKGPFPGASAQRLFGVYPAIVHDVKGAHRQGTIEIELPWLPSDDVTGARVKARLATMMAGSGRGTWFIPEPRDEVLVSFIGGDPRHPVVVGALWNGQDTPPETMDADGRNHVRSITSESGHKVVLDDTPNQEKVELSTKSGHKLTLDDAAGGTVTLTHNNGAKVVIDSQGTVTITANQQLKVTAPSGVKITAAQVQVDAALAKFSGVVQCAVLNTNLVRSSVYTPGAGNVW